jgi:hypothetical protein
MTSARRWFWKHIRRYRYEICSACGKPVGHRHRFGNEPITWWHAPDYLWRLIEGGPGGLRCPQCFTRDCENSGVPICWEAVEDV